MTADRDWKNAVRYTMFSSWFVGTGITGTTARRIREFETWEDCVSRAKRSKSTVSVRILASFGDVAMYVPDEVWQN